MAEKLEIYLSSTHGWHPCTLKESKNNNFTVTLQDICLYDESSDNKVEANEKEFTTTKNNLRPLGSPYGEEHKLETGQEIEIWQSLDDQIYGWYNVKVTKIKKNVVYISTDLDLEPMVPRQATRLPNTATLTLGQTETLNLGVPDNIIEFIENDFGDDLLRGLKQRKNLGECEYLSDEKCILLSGLKSNIDSAAQFLQFNFDNLIYISELKNTKNNLEKKLKDIENQYKSQYKKEFYVPGEIVGLLVGKQYSKLKVIQDKYKVNVSVGEEEGGARVKFTIQGNDKEMLDLIEKKLHIEKHEYHLEKKSVAYLIGQKGERIKQIIENSQLIKIDFDNANNNTSKNEKICYLYGNRDAINEGIDYIDSAVSIQTYIDEESKEIETIQQQTNNVMNENGFYTEEKRQNRPQRDREPARDNNYRNNNDDGNRRRKRERGKY